MKAIISKFSLLFVLIFSLQVFSQDDMEKLKAAVQEGNDKYAKAMIDGSYESTLELYADDAIVMPSYSPMQKGIKEIKDGMSMDAQSGNKYTEFSLTASDVFQHGNLVYEIGKYKLTLEVKGMNNPIKDEGKFLTIFEKQDDGSLKIKADIWNTDMNPWASMKNTGNDD